VFFLISGYLITTIIINELNNNTFSIVNFYERRARRILPALFFVMIACVPFAWFWLMPREMKDFAQSLSAVSIFASNVLFWKEGGYFDIAAELKPLLHTWSLAVEEQYYIIFPILLILLRKIGITMQISVLILIFLLSFIFALYWNDTDPVAVFYLLPFRIWEILLGSFVAYYMYLNKFYLIRYKELLSNFGLILIIFSIFVINKNTVHPVLLILLTTAGTVLIILYAETGTFVNKLLGARGLVGIGLISYSAYLWHQPIFAFAKQGVYGEPSLWVFGLLIALTFALAFGTWKYVERPFRTRGLVRRRPFLSLCVATGTGLMLMGIAGHKTDGFMFRADPNHLQGNIGHVAFHERLDKNFLDCEPRKIAELAPGWRHYSRCKQSKRGRPEVVLLGDSHAEHLFEGVAEMLPTVNTGFYLHEKLPDLASGEVNPIYDELINNNKKQTIIVSFHYKNLFNTYGQEKIEYLLNNIVRSLKEAGNRVVVLGDVPYYAVDPAYCVYSLKGAGNRRSALCAMSVADALKQQESYSAVLENIASNLNIEYIKLTESLCDSKCGMNNDDYILYRDNNHLNLFGNRVVSKYLFTQSETLKALKR